MNYDFEIAFLLYNFICFVSGLIFKNATLSSQERTEHFGFRIIYILIPMFFVGYYSSDFLLKDWTKK